MQYLQPKTSEKPKFASQRGPRWVISIFGAALLVGGSAAAAAPVAATPVTAAPVAASLVAAPKPCHLTETSEWVLCAEAQVPENPDQPDGRQLRLPIVVLPATGGDPKPDPIFVLAGGPGQAAHSLIPYAQTFLSRARRQRDLVFVDIRGTGGENRLDCALGQDLAQEAAGPQVEPMKVCLETLQRKADLRFYSTFHAMRDLDQVRTALGYRQINLWGGSYGTRAAMVYQALYPEQTRALVLDGLAPFEVQLPLHNAQGAQRALDLLFAACAQDPGCRALAPAPAETLRGLLERLRSQPASIELLHPRTGEPLRLSMNAAMLAGILRILLYEAGSAGQIPFILQRAALDDWRPLVAALEALSDQVGKTMALGLTWSVLCSEDMAQFDPTELETQTAGTFLGRAEADAWLAVCAFWPPTVLPANFAQQLPRSEKPALLLSGELDPVVPPLWGEKALALFPAGRHLQVPGTAHNTSHVGCVPDLITRFFENPDPQRLEVACLEAITRPAFQTSAAGSEP